VNEESASESFSDLTLTYHFRDEGPELREVRVHLKVNPFRAWYYCISLNFHNLMILLQVDPASGDELETIWEGCYKIENTSIFAWSSILDVGHYF